MKSLLAAASLAFLLGACGQKGPLYLPDEGGEVVVRPAPATTTTTTTTTDPSQTDPEDEAKSKPAAPVQSPVSK